jgi:hypothetical protein
MENIDSTRAFFAQPTRVVSNELQSRIIIDKESGKRIRIEQVQPFPEVGKLYNGIADLQPGELWTPYRRTLQSLVVVRKEQDPGSCVRIVRSSYFDEEKQEYVFSDNESTTGSHLGMERGSVGSLRFLDKSGVLYLFKEDEVLLAKNKISAKDANQQLLDFVSKK